MDSFDDFLDLRKRDLRQQRLVVFHGASGSGKSTAIEFLLREQFSDRSVTRVDHGRFESSAGRPDVLVIDEILSLGDFAASLPAIARARTALVASHFPLIFFAPFRCFRKTALFRTDRCSAKISRYLAARRVDASEAAVRSFVRRFGATYTDVDLILERAPGADFDRALDRFVRFDALRLDAHP